MDNYNHIMDSEYANIVYQTQVDVLPNAQQDIVGKEFVPNAEVIAHGENASPTPPSTDILTLDTPQQPIIMPTLSPENILYHSIETPAIDTTAKQAVLHSEVLETPATVIQSDALNNGLTEEAAADTLVESEFTSVKEAEDVSNTTNQDNETSLQQKDEPKTRDDSNDEVSAPVESVIAESAVQPEESVEDDGAIKDTNLETDALNDDANVENTVKTSEDVLTEQSIANLQPVVEIEKLVIPDESANLIVPDDDINSIVRQEEEIDTNQCRICLSTENLVNIFKYDHKNGLRVCDMIMKLCPNVKISERDYLPHFVCAQCTDRVTNAYELRLQCEETEKVLRSKLKRSKKTTRNRSEFVLIDCAEFSSGSDDDKNKDDDEFHLSEVTLASEPDSDISFEERKKRTTRTKRKPKATKRKSGTSRTPTSKRTRNNVVYIEAPPSDEEDDDEEYTTKRGSRRGRKAKSVNEYPCNSCSKVCTSAEMLRQHKRVHVDEKPVPCPICNKMFKQQFSLTAHMQKHKEDDERTCQQCNTQFASKVELRRHTQTAHGENFKCDQCKRTFSTKTRLDKHKCSHEANSKRKNDYDYGTNSGRDLFKSVAPLTTTYWSDSFSD